MKRLFATLTIAFSFFSMSSFANDHTPDAAKDNVTPAALKSFNSSFRNATEVMWSVSSNFYKANFAMNGQYVSAYYDQEGKMVALTRNISSMQLPLALQSSLKEKYEDFWISDLFEVANDQGTTYYTTVENADKKIVLKSSGNDWSVYQKFCKS